MAGRPESSRDASSAHAFFPRGGRCGTPSTWTDGAPSSWMRTLTRASSALRAPGTSGPYVAACAASRLRVTTSTVFASSALGLNSTTSVPANSIGRCPGRA